MLQMLAGVIFVLNYGLAQAVVSVDSNIKGTYGWCEVYDYR